MVVAAHGSVDAYCLEHGMTIGERYTGKVEDYRGSHLILVTDNCDSLNDYYYQKHKLRRRGVELVSTHWRNEDVAAFVEHLTEREAEERKRVFSGRTAFGFRRVNGEDVEIPAAMVVARRIIAMRDAGATYKLIAEDPDVAYPDGRRMSISTIQVILKNREKYE